MGMPTCAASTVTQRMQNPSARRREYTWRQTSGMLRKFATFSNTITSTVSLWPAGRSPPPTQSRAAAGLHDDQLDSCRYKGNQQQFHRLGRAGRKRPQEVGVPGSHQPCVPATQRLLCPSDPHMLSERTTVKVPSQGLRCQKIDSGFSNVLAVVATAPVGTPTADHAASARSIRVAGPSATRQRQG